MAKLHFISDMSKQIVLFPHWMDEKIAAVLSISKCNLACKVSQSF